MGGSSGEPLVCDSDGASHPASRNIGSAGRLPPKGMCCGASLELWRFSATDLDITAWDVAGIKGLNSPHYLSVGSKDPTSRKTYAWFRPLLAWLRKIPHCIFPKHPGTPYDSGIPSCCLQARGADLQPSQRG